MLDVVEILIEILREEDDIFDVQQAHTPTDTGEDDINRTLEDHRHIKETERHADISVSTHMTRERCLISILFGDGHLQVSPESVNEREELAPDRLFDSVIHLRERVSVLNGIHVEAKEVACGWQWVVGTRERIGDGGWWKFSGSGAMKKGLVRDIMPSDWLKWVADGVRDRIRGGALSLPQYGRVVKSKREFVLSLVRNPEIHHPSLFLLVQPVAYVRASAHALLCLMTLQLTHVRKIRQLPSNLSGVCAHALPLQKLRGGQR